MAHASRFDERAARERRTIRLRIAVSYAASATAFVFLFFTSANSQSERPPESGGTIASLGQPPLVKWQAGLAAGAYLHHDLPNQLAIQAFVGAARDLFNPVAGLANIGFEAYAGAYDANLDGGARVVFRVPYLSMGAGLDYNLRAGSLDPMITLYGPIRRGGIVSRGGLIRADVFPSRRSFMLGVSLPVADPLAGRGRPLRDYVVVAKVFEKSVEYDVHEPALDAVQDSLRISAEWIRRLVVPFLDQDGRTAAIATRRTESYVRELHAHLTVRSFAEEVRHFHAQLEHAFTLAAGDTTAGRLLAVQARAVLLDEILLPYNRLLGRKKRGDTVEELATVARGRFSRWVTASEVVPAERSDRALFVFQRVTQLMDDVRVTAAREWNDARLVWLPLQYALLPEDHDEQVELDALLARATGVSVTSNNRIRYVANLQFHWELLRSIRETDNYHVLWVHDFPSVTSQGKLDWAAYGQLVDGYLTALAERIEAYDKRGTLPSYFIFLDQFYYESRRSRILMTILEDPLDASALPRGIGGDRAPLERALARLRAAVQGSRVLQAEARQYGDAWLKNRVKVHVNVTNRPDASFWSGSLIATMFGYPDNVMRDHRKIAFRDVSDADPRAGIAILTGMGVGQHYLGPGWEDRSLIIEGPTLLGLTRAARELLLSQGMKAADIPFALRAGSPAPVPTTFIKASDSEEFESSALLLVNGTGYLAKAINVAKALLYSLMPPGSVIKIPDSLWNSAFFGGLLTGASIRGCTVSIIAPALANAPSSGFPQMARAHELLTRLVVVRHELADAIQLSGGELRVGLYALAPDHDGFASRADAWARHVTSSPASRALGPAVNLLPVVTATTTRRQAFPLILTPVRVTPLTPKLHQKVQYLATGELWDAIALSREWASFMSSYLSYRQATHTISDTGESVAAQAYPALLARTARRVFGGAGENSRAASYALVGSQNMDYRGMFMDGEVGVLFGGSDSLVPLLDLIFLEGTVTWLDDQATLDRLLPPPTEMQRRFARVFKDAM